MFKESFKYYKSKNPPPNLDEVLDFDCLEKITSKIIRIPVGEVKTSGNIFGLTSALSWNAFQIVEHPGLIFIKNPFTSIGQRYWAVRCLRDYSRKPSKSNLDALNLVPQEKEWWEICQQNSQKSLLNKLRWVTLGYHHNWETKRYNETDQSEFPKDLAGLTKHVALQLGFEDFNAEAAIVNYYLMDSTLSGHVDHSEEDLEAPIISLSFGQTAIFLLGGKTKEEKPSAMFLRSGDIIVMTQESRLCYHGVPKILQMDSRFWDCFNQTDFVNKALKEVVHICQDEVLWKPFDSYLRNARININVRQVLKRGQKRLRSESEDKV